MNASKSLRRPENWQDFETLCKKLWGEIWECQEIKKNGRAGQNQNGVDIYGIPKGEKEYFGIQCKGKDEYTNKQITTEEIIEEIEKAKTFTPALKKLYFATTAIKDVKIEEVVRKKNIEHLKIGIFEVHIFSWEDIVELLDENRQTHDWYVKSQNFKARQNAILTFHDGSEELNITVKFLQIETEYKLRDLVKSNNLIKINQPFLYLDNKFQILMRNPFENNTKNFSLINFKFVLQNIGLSPIEDFKIFIEFKGEFTNLMRTYKRDASHTQKDTKQYNNFLYKCPNNIDINPIEKIIVSGDKIWFDNFRLKPIHDIPTTIIVNWQLISRDYKNNGILTININPEIITEKKVEYVDDISDVKTVLGEVEDYKKNIN